MEATGGTLGSWFQTGTFLNLDHTIPLPAVAVITKCFEVDQAIASALCEGEPMMNFEANTHPASSATHAGKMISL